MIKLTTTSLSDKLSFDAVLQLLRASPLVDGIAEFGARAARQDNPSSDYDLLVLVRNLPASVFQLVTTIDGRLADIVPVDMMVADRLLAVGSATNLDHFDQLFIQKMATAKILFDRNERLIKLQRLSQTIDQAKRLSPPQDEASRYSAWFWQSFGLLHLERMAVSSDPLHQTAADMMLLSCLVGTWRSYFDLRDIPWAGEKAALRYWLQHDRTCYELVQAVLAASERFLRLKAYQQLVNYVVEPVGPVIQKGQTAVILGTANNSNIVSEVITYWNGLLELALYS